MDSLTPEEFLKLAPADHLRATMLYSERIGQTLATLERYSLPPEERKAFSDDASSYRVLRKVHEGRLYELLAGMTTPQPAAS